VTGAELNEAMKRRREGKLTDPPPVPQAEEGQAGPLHPDSSQQAWEPTGKRAFTGAQLTGGRKDPQVKPETDPGSSQASVVVGPETGQAVRAGLAVGGVLYAVWLLAKLAAPLCGPGVLVCAYAF
jgi:hypothetical protein